MIKDHWPEAALFSTPILWQFLNEWGHIVLVFLGICLTGVKLATYIRAYRKGNRHDS